jgi:hypothetical protein
MNHLFREKDDLGLAATICEMAPRFGASLERVPPAERPPEVAYLVAEADYLFSHYDGAVANENVGDTQVFEFSPGVTVAVRHFYPDHPERAVSLNDLGELGEGGSRLVPVSLLCRDLNMDGLLVGRFLAALSKYSARRDAPEEDFYLQIMVMSVIGSGQYRENLGFRGAFNERPMFETSLNPQDFAFATDIFGILEKSYGANGLQFVTHEIMRNRHFLSELAGRDVGLNLAFDAYVKQFGGFMSDQLARRKADILAEAERLSR